MACRFDNFWFWCTTFMCQVNRLRGLLLPIVTWCFARSSDERCSRHRRNYIEFNRHLRRSGMTRGKKSNHLRSSQRAMTRWIHRRDDVKTLDFSRTLWGISNSLQSSSSSAGGKEIAGADSHMLQLRCSHWKLPWASWAGGCLQRMKSTMQLHRIVEATFS